MAVWLNGHVAKVGPLNMEVQFRDPILAPSSTPRIPDPPGPFPLPHGILQQWAASLYLIAIKGLQ